MPLGSSSATPVTRPGPTFAKGCFFARRQRAASDFNRWFFFSPFLDGCTAPHFKSRENQGQVSSLTAPAAVYPRPAPVDKFLELLEFPKIPSPFTPTLQHDILSGFSARRILAGVWR